MILRYWKQILEADEDPVQPVRTGGRPSSCTQAGTMVHASGTRHVPPPTNKPECKPYKLRTCPTDSQVVPARAQGLPKSSATTQFAEDLFNRIPRASGAQVGSYQQQERAAAAYARKAAAYTVLSDDEEDQQADVDLPAPTTQAIPKGAKKQLRKAQVPILCVSCCEVDACQGRAALWCAGGRNAGMEAQPGFDCIWNSRSCSHAHVTCPMAAAMGCLSPLIS